MCFFYIGKEYRTKNKIEGKNHLSKVIRYVQVEANIVKIVTRVKKILQTKILRNIQRILFIKYLNFSRLNFCPYSEQI